MDKIEIQRAAYLKRDKLALMLFAFAVSPMALINLAKTQGWRVVGVNDVKALAQQSSFDHTPLRLIKVSAKDLDLSRQKIVWK